MENILILKNKENREFLNREFAKIGVQEDKVKAILRQAVKEQNDQLDREFVIETTLKDIDVEVKEDAETRLKKEEFYNLIDMLETVDSAKFKAKLVGTNSKQKQYYIELGILTLSGLDFVLEGFKKKEPINYYTYNGDIFVKGIETLVITPLFTNEEAEHDK